MGRSKNNNRGSSNGVGSDIVKVGLGALIAGAGFLAFKAYEKFTRDDKAVN